MISDFALGHAIPMANIIVIINDDGHRNNVMPMIVHMWSLKTHSFLR